MTKLLGCRGCLNPCKDKKRCTPFRGELRPYLGVHYTADSFDCAMPVAIDGHSMCSHRCMYCFTVNLMHDPCRDPQKFKVGQFRLKHLERALSDPEHGIYKTIHEIAEGRGISGRAPVQWGTLSEPFDHVERHQGWSLRAMRIFEKYDQPVHISTKGADVLLSPQYLESFARRPELWCVSMSLITIDDAMLLKLERGTPPVAKRLEAMRQLHNLGVAVSLRMRPALPGVTDQTDTYKHAWRDLLRAAERSGARAVNLQYAFIPKAMPAHVKRMWKNIEQATGAPLIDFYRSNSFTLRGGYLRASRAWKEDLTYAIRDECHELGMVFACSDPHFKELSDTGCCCGIMADDPVFGGWQRQQAAEALVQARLVYEKSGRSPILAVEGVLPAWSFRERFADQVCASGPLNAFKRETWWWKDKLIATWNDLRGARGPLHYFEGVMQPVDRDKNGNVRYKYVPYKRRFKPSDTPRLSMGR